MEEQQEKENSMQEEPMQEQTHRRRRRTRQTQETLPDEMKTQEAVEAEDGDVFWHPDEDVLAPKQEEKKRKAAPLRAISAVDGAICRIGDFLLSAVQWIGIGMLYAGGFAADAAKKLFAKAKPALQSTGKKAKHRRAVHRGRRINAKQRKTAQETAQETEITLTPTRPQDYKGMGQKRVVRAPGKKNSVVYSAAMALLICIALISLYMIASILWRSISTKMLSNSLSQRYSELSESDEMTEESEIAGTENTAIPAFVLEETPSPVVLPAPEAKEETLDQPAQESLPQPAKQEKQKDAVVSTKFHQVGGDALPEMEALYSENRDLIGWLRMEGILDLPVVYRDNSYYLTRDFYKNKSASGTLFLDENHPFRENAQNLLLHGHNMKDGTMFGRLVQYETNLQFLKNNPFIQYSTLWRKEQYVIFAVMSVSLDVHDDRFFNYFTHHTFSSDAQFENYVRALQNRSTFSIPVDVDPSDALLTLSTCLDDDRLVIVARRLREGESKSTLRHLVQLADKQ